MFQRDYLLSMIEQIGALVGHIFDKNITHESTEIELEALSAQWIGLPSSMLLSLPAREVYRLFQESDRMVAEKCFLMAEVCRAKGVVSIGKDDQREYFDKALYFFGKCSGDILDEEIQRKIDEHVATLKAGNQDTGIEGSGSQEL